MYIMNKKLTDMEILEIAFKRVTPNGIVTKRAVDRFVTEMISLIDEMAIYSFLASIRLMGSEEFNAIDLMLQTNNEQEYHIV